MVKVDKKWLKILYKLKLICIRINILFIFIIKKNYLENYVNEIKI